MVTMPMSARSSSRNGTPVVWVCLHTSEGGGTARQLRDATWWEGSSHAVCDNTELLTPAQGCVPYDRGSWTLRNGNVRSVNIEQIGYAKWTRDYWLTERMPQLRFTAKWIADVAAQFGIPVNYIGIQGVQARAKGVIQHNDYSKGTGDGTHWDCGPGYPVDVVINMARGAVPPPAQEEEEETDMFIIGINDKNDTRRMLIGLPIAIGITLAEQTTVMAGGVKSGWVSGPTFNALWQDSIDQRGLLRAQAAALPPKE